MDLEDPTPVVDQVFLGCTQRAAIIDEEPKTNLFHHKIPHPRLMKNRTGKSIIPRCDTKGHAAQCVEGCCESVQKLASPNHYKKSWNDALYTLNLSRAQQLGLQFFQSRSCCLIHFGNVPPAGLLNVESLRGELLCAKSQIDPHSSKRSLQEPAHA